jgi:hypothetical protein
VSRVYSERFVHGRAAAATQTYVVPAGRRAVVRFLSFNFYVGTHDYALLRVGGFAVVYLDHPAALSARTFDGRWVAYGGEEIEVITATADCAWHASGYLLYDP